MSVESFANIVSGEFRSPEDPWAALDLALDVPYLDEHGRLGNWAINLRSDYIGWNTIQTVNKPIFDAVYSDKSPFMTEKRWDTFKDLYLVVGFHIGTAEPNITFREQYTEAIVCGRSDITRSIKHEREKRDITAEQAAELIAMVSEITTDYLREPADNFRELTDTASD